MSVEQVVALVGQRDEPTDGVADYCYWLGGALKSFGCNLQTVRVRWPEIGWRAALAELNEISKDWSGSWVLLQYTAMAWSRRGFPGHVPDIISKLKTKGIRCGVVFHDFHPFPGERLIDRVRRSYQLRILLRLYRLADAAVFTVPPEKVNWVPQSDRKSTFIPVGANCPESAAVPRDSEEPKTIAVYGVTGGKHIAQEVHEIGYAVKRATRIVGAVRLVVFGRGSQDAASALQAEFSGTDIDMRILGLLSAEDVTQALAQADVLLFIRGGISTRRGSAIAGIAAGLPIVGFQSVDTAWPLTEAGLVLVQEGDRESLSAALVKVLSDPSLRQALRQRSRNAQEQYFSWRAIAGRFATVLNASGKPVEKAQLLGAGAAAR